MAGIAHLPKISVITVVYNNAKFIEGCIKSVINQDYPNLEYVVIDGCSTDGTSEIIQQHEPKITQYICEPDNGIGDAMNKGIRLSTGDYLIFLHADDHFFEESSISKATEYLQDTNTEILLCDILFGNSHDRKSSRGFDWKMNFKTGVWHQGSLCSKNLFNKVGNFDSTITIAMDYDFFLRAYREGFKAKKCNTILSVMRETGISSRRDWPTLYKRFNDEKKIHFRHCKRHWLKFTYKLYWFFYLPFRRLKSTTLNSR